MQLLHLHESSTLTFTLTYSHKLHQAGPITELGFGVSIALVSRIVYPVTKLIKRIESAHAGDAHMTLRKHKMRVQDNKKIKKNTSWCDCARCRCVVQQTQFLPAWPEGI